VALKIDLSKKMGHEKQPRSGRISKYLLLVLTFLVSMEVGAHIVLSVNSLRRRLVAFDDSSWRLTWIAAHRAHREINGQYAAYHATRGWTLRPDIRDMSVFDGKILNSNSKGLRGKSEYPYERPSEKQRVLVLGDSYTFGDEVSDDETYCHYLEALLPNTEVLNLGVQGYGQDQMLLYLKEEGIKYHPNVVILGFAYLDIYRNLLSFFGYAKPEFKIVSGSLELTNVPVPAPDHFLSREPYRPKTLDLAVMLRARLLFKLGITEKKAKKRTTLILDQIAATTRSIGAVPVFVYLPILSETADASERMNKNEQFLYDYCQKRSVPCFFVRSQFRHEINGRVRFTARSGHWNPKAHLIAAEGMKAFLLGSNLIKTHSTSAASTVSAQVIHKSKASNLSGQAASAVMR